MAATLLIYRALLEEALAILVHIHQKTEKKEVAQHHPLKEPNTSSNDPAEFEKAEAAQLNTGSGKPSCW